MARGKRSAPSSSSVTRKTRTRAPKEPTDSASSHGSSSLSPARNEELDEPITGMFHSGDLDMGEGEGDVGDVADLGDLGVELDLNPDDLENIVKQMGDNGELAGLGLGEDVEMTGGEDEGDGTVEDDDDGEVGTEDNEGAEEEDGEDNEEEDGDEDSKDLDHDDDEDEDEEESKSKTLATTKPSEVASSSKPVFRYPPAVPDWTALPSREKLFKVARFLKCTETDCDCTGMEPPQNADVVLGSRDDQAPSVAADDDERTQEGWWKYCGACSHGWEDSGQGGHIWPPNLAEAEKTRRGKVAGRIEELLQVGPTCLPLLQITDVDVGR